jgi:murein endopeptidase
MLTWELLRRPALVQLPQIDGMGYYRYNPDNPLSTAMPDRQYGTPQTIEAIKWVAGHFFRMMKYNGLAIPGNRPYLEIGIGDISKPRGGPFGIHQEHRWGTDVDVRPLRKDGKRFPLFICDPSNPTKYDPQYDQDATTTLVQAFLDNSNVESILFNDPAIIKKFPGRVWSEKGHFNHLHVNMRA